MDYKSALSVIDKLKSLDLEKVSNAEVKDLLRLIIYIPLPVVFLNSGVRIIRCRTISISKDIYVQKRIYCTYAEFSNPKRKKYFTIGRANSKDTSVFYGGIESKVMNGFNTASFELIPTSQNEKDKDRKLDFKTLDLVAGIWIVQRAIPIIILGSLSDDYINLNSLGHERQRMIKDFLEKNPENADVMRLVDGFLGKEFSKEVKKGEEYNYKISANYVDLLQEIKMFKGVIYPSIKSAGAGINIALFPKSVRNKYVKLAHGVYSVFYNRDNECINEYPLKGDYAGGKIRWKEYLEQKKTPPIIRNYYLGHSDDDSFKQYIPMVDLSKPITSE